jgi:hypothetical protein
MNAPNFYKYHGKKGFLLKHDADIRYANNIVQVLASRLRIFCQKAGHTVHIVNLSSGRQQNDIFLAPKRSKGQRNEKTTASFFNGSKITYFHGRAPQVKVRLFGYLACLNEC